MALITAFFLSIFGIDKPDYEKYLYFEFNLTTHTVPEPSPATYLERLSKRQSQIEYIGKVSDAVLVRVQKSEEIDAEGLREVFETIDGVESVELQDPNSGF